MAQIAEHAVVIGAGMGGLSAAAAAAPYFERITIVDRDTLPAQADWRIGTPQCRHAHMLLIGGLMALNDLAPGFADDLARAGAVPIRYSLDVNTDAPGYDPVPRRDLGLPNGYSMTRPLLERTLRRRIEALGGVTLWDRTRVQALIPDPGRRDVAGVRILRDGATQDIAADLVIDSSGRGQPTIDFLGAIGLSPPEEDVIGVNATYTSALLAKPAGWTDDWKAAIAFPDAPHDRLGAFLFSVEGAQWVVSIQEMHGEPTPTDWYGLLAEAKKLRTSTVYDAIKDAKPVSDVVRFRRSQNTRRHFERYARFPTGLVACADAVCQFNPIYGQGMTSAAQQARLLSEVLADRSVQSDPLDGLAEAFFARVPAVTGGPWSITTGFDLRYPQTTGERPPDFDRSIAFGRALNELVARDADAHRLFTEVGHCVKPPTAFQDPAFAGRVMAVMSESQALA
jgi:2-polyprenyl-6-methoxyphenol hydroxylase-like FAD-dependent oxidoreductase